MFRRVMVANRGEVALRVLRTLHEMGVEGVLACSEEDAARPPALADRVICMGPDEPGRSYLSSYDVLNAAVACGADAVHPGYGFLSEDADFCRLCGEVGVRFIGPSPEAMRRLGDKAEVCKAAAACGVPVLFLGKAERVEEVERMAGPGRYPLVLKPCGGGGGRGIRVVESPGRLRESWLRAERESRMSFRHDGFYVERYLAHARHVEVQLLLDQEGRAAALPARDCSLQFRHQKWVEETPAPGLSPRVQERIEEDALRLGSECGLSGLATVEFLVRGEEYFFIEINPRLQVEHTVSEMVTGMDLVKEQLELAAGRPLARPGEPRGHAVQARLYLRGAAAPGGIRLRLPGGPGIRVDAAQAGGGPVSSYDPLLAKVCAWAPTRKEALARLGRALRETELRGAPGNLETLRALVGSDDFAEARCHTGSLEEMLGARGAPRPGSGAPVEAPAVGS